MIQLVRFLTPAGPRFGCSVDGRLYASTRYRNSLEALEDWPALDEQLRTGVCDGAWEPVGEAVLLAPLESPRNIYFAGANYRDHVDEMRRKLNMPLDLDPRASGIEPWHGLKATGVTVTGPDSIVALPGRTASLDWELELAVVIGRPAYQVPEAQALNYVAGYTVANDLSDRARVGREGVEVSSPFKWDWIGQKSFNGSCPLGPAVTPAHAIGDAGNLGMMLWVNGELMQDSNTSQMIYSVAEQVSCLSQRLTLLPGDVVLTGTPSGVGAARGRFLRGGDVVRQWIERIGEFEFAIA